MATDKDFNDALEEIFLGEEAQHKESYDEGFKAGAQSGNPEGYHLGYHRGAELGRELGCYLGTITHHINSNEKSETKYSEKLLNQLTRVKELIGAFPRDNSEDQDILGMAENIRAHYKKACALLKVPSANPYDGVHTQSTIQPMIIKLQRHIDSITNYLTPLLPLANCHMVEFFTQDHWEKLVPIPLRKYLDDMDMNEAVDKFWTAAEGQNKGDCEISKWVQKARSNYLTINNDYCISGVQLQSHIKAWGGDIKSEIRVKEFMSGKKSYEVQAMSRLVASLHGAVKSSCCVEAGGGRGHLPVALSLGYAVPSLTIDCDGGKLAAAKQRVKIIQKQWHAIAKRIHEGNEEQISQSTNKNLHRFAESYITKDTDLNAIVKEQFPEHSGETRLLLTGLHTCGNLGPDSLRLFVTQPHISAVFNVPCCYHHLTETVDVDLFDVFQKEYGGSERKEGFPMSEYLRGYNIGRNARMLAAQSIDRVVNQRQLPSESLLYRALLQVIIKKHKPDLPLTEGKLKHLKSKCDNFKQYFKTADAILKLDLFDSLPDSYLTEVPVDCQWKKIVLFNSLRLCLAQVIESLILLDRLLFLMENGFEKAYLVKLFNPVLSPRCHSIVAVR